MKRFLGLLSCFIMTVGFLGIPIVAAEANRLFSIDADRVDTVKINTGSGSRRTLRAPGDKEEIYKIVESLNAFEYKEIKWYPKSDGGYVYLRIVDTDGVEQSINVMKDGVMDTSGEMNKKFVSSTPDYFGESWLKSISSEDFIDVDLWQNYSVQYAYDRGFMLGTSKRTFSPEAPLTRGMYVTILGRMAKIAPTEYQEAVFADVQEGHYYFSYVSWAVKNGVIREAGETFSPETLITREEVVVLLARFAQAQQLDLPDMVNSEPQFNDIENTSEEFRTVLSELHRAQILPAKNGEPLFFPKDTMTREEGAKLLYRIYVTFVQTGQMPPL